ncbi:TetR/AcrR family transcriptional regulator [Photobacterium sp. WH77]|uniref:TetR/AcrR family transcriptional regulator n=1 Tax=unclassified Photobacterium TaxID=2628852 RepID=UPI001EDB0FAF|nr:MULTISPECIES: TetR/AcrR family transcriptional regulator [unclassified Photobacterium]MCG2837231.1 TetR/AcrR family transcriptional regulator [Photobacterium sp. WH77]MCG2844847.1 TetR/AcrR family transcriptional regulator [Photobacterium sp. WH80]
MSKGRVTREHILRTAFDLASRDGLDSLTVGQLAKASGMSKSGLFAHFNSKENLQVAVLQFAGEYFAQHVIQPARLADWDSVEEKIRLLLQNWLAWNHSFQGSCMFIDAWKEGRCSDHPVQQELDIITRRWMDYLCRQVEQGKTSGEFRTDLDTWQSVFRLYGAYLSSQLFHSLGLEADGSPRFWMDVDLILASCRSDSKQD